jgi:hypothetical protein
MELQTAVFSPEMRNAIRLKASTCCRSLGRTSGRPLEEGGPIMSTKSRQTGILLMAAAALFELSAVAKSAPALPCLGEEDARLGNPCITRIQMVGSVLHFSWDTRNGGVYDFFQIHTAIWNTPWHQETINSSGADGSWSFRTQPGTTYRFGVQGCKNSPPLLGSLCSPWYDAVFTPPSAETCSQGFVWREAVAGDHVCVTPAQRDQTQRDNSLAASRLQSDGSCEQGFVWREATPTDHVCVSPQTRAEVASENAFFVSH